MYTNYDTLIIVTRYNRGLYQDKRGDSSSAWSWDPEWLTCANTPHDVGVAWTLVSRIRNTNSVKRYETVRSRETRWFAETRFQRSWTVLPGQDFRRSDSSKGLFSDTVMTIGLNCLLNTHCLEEVYIISSYRFKFFEPTFPNFSLRILLRTSKTLNYQEE